MSKELIIQEKLIPIFEQVDILVIASPKAVEKATEMLSQINLRLDEIETERTKVTEPLNKALKAENGRWKPIREKLEAARDSLRKGMTAYQTEQKRLAQIEEEKIIARVKEGKGNLTAETAVAKIEKIDKPEESVSTNSGSVKFRTVEKFELEDISKVPARYLLINETEVRIAMKDGLKLPGIRYYTEEMVINSR